MRHLIRFSALVALATAASCGDDTITVPQQPAACSGAIAVSVSSAATPTFSWSPNCGISNLVVIKKLATGDSTVWSISVPEQTRMGGPITYGHGPSFATEGTHPRTLDAGAQYLVVAFMTVGLDVLGARGDATFTVPAQVVSTR